MPVVSKGREGDGFHGIRGRLDVRSLNQTGDYNRRVAIATQHHVVGENRNIPVALNPDVMRWRCTPCYRGNDMDSLIHRESSDVCCPGDACSPRNSGIAISNVDNDPPGTLNVARAVKGHIRRAEVA